MARTIMALYDDLDTAHRVVEELIDAGFDHEQISLIARDPDGRHGTWLKEGKAAAGKGTHGSAADGAIVGGLVGALAGLLLGLSAFTLPGVGPVVIAGPIYTALMGATAGGIGGGLLGALVESGVPEDVASDYVAGIRRGHVLVMVEAEEADVERVSALLAAHRPLDLGAEAEGGRTGDWPGYDEAPDAFVPSEEEQTPKALDPE